MRRVTIALVSLAVVLVAASLVWAAAQARIRGTVVNTAGEPVPEAVVTITSDEVTDYSKTVEVSENGAYSVLILDATVVYAFHVEAPGYVPQEQVVKVGVGTTDNTIDFQLVTEAEAAEEQQKKVMQQPGYRQLKQAMDRIEAGETAAARSLLEEAVGARPDLLAAWEQLATLEYDSGAHEAALERAVGCLELDPESVPCLAVAVNAAKELGDIERAEAYRARYEAANPEDPATLYNQAVPHINNYDDGQARPLLEQCLEVDPGFASCLFEYGMLLLRAGDMEGAREHLERYLEVAPDGKDASTARETLNYL
jgi:Tfp pilus assembly protein PilF